MSIVQREDVYVDGGWSRAVGPDRIRVFSPHTEQLLALVPDGGIGDIDRAVSSARRAFDTGEWPRLRPEERIKVVERFAEAYGARSAEMAGLITSENGSPITFSKAVQVGGPIGILGGSIRAAKGFPWVEQRPGMLNRFVTVRHEPVGVVAAIVPWNVPQYTTMTKLAPALLAGCTVVLKPSPETPLDAYLLMESVHAAGFPPGVVNMVPAGRDGGEHLVRHPDVDKVAFTGSTAAGRRIASLCGQDLKRCSLELGGKSAAIILDDADLASTVKGLRSASLLNNGQACTNQTRILASRKRYGEVLDAVVESFGSMWVGDPMDPMTHIGPMVSERHRDRVESYIELGEREGATAALGGSGRFAGLHHGWYVRPTVFSNATNDMRICREEIFGPVVAVIAYENVDDAVRIANDSEYGLAGSVWTTDDAAGSAVAAQVRTGTFGINNYGAEFLAPFGGYKDSGIGRELGVEGLGLYVELKTVFPDPRQRVADQAP